MVKFLDDETQKQVYMEFARGSTANTEWYGNEVGLRILSRASPEVADSTFIYSGQEHCTNSLSIIMDDTKLNPDEFERAAEFIRAFFDDGSPAVPSDNYECPTCNSEAQTGCDGIQGSGLLTDNCGNCPSVGVNCIAEEPAWIEGSCPESFI